MTAEDTIIARLRTTVPPDVLARDDEEVLKSWIADATAEINGRRWRQTMHEVTITLSSGISAYDLPQGCIRVNEVIKVGVATQDQKPLGIPIPTFYGTGLRLPTGQGINNSVSFIRRQGLHARDREIRWHTLEGQIWFDFPCSDGEFVRVVYVTEDRDPESLPTRYWNPVVDYLRARTIEHQIHVMIGVGDTAADGIRRAGAVMLSTLLTRLDERWKIFIAGVSPQETD